ncbi:MAG: MBL fold metallo-hydrolase [Bacteroidota bacterium]
MKVKFYGTRGSIPVCEREFQEFGGNTSCVQVTFSDGKIAVLDAGSGIRNLGKDLIRKEHEQFDDIFIALSHFHWDHIQGFPFFQPAYDVRRHFTISAMGKGRNKTSLRSIFERQMQKEFFPVRLDGMGASFKFDSPTEESLIYGNVRVKASLHYHPGGAYGYRMENEGKVLVYVTDVEHGDSLDTAVIDLAEGADLLIHDAQYTTEELKERRGWGHSSWQQAVEVARLAGVRQLALTHHDPDHTDEFLLHIEKQCQERFAEAFLARERMEITL